MNCGTVWRAEQDFQLPPPRFCLKEAVIPEPEAAESPGGVVHGKANIGALGHALKGQACLQKPESDRCGSVSVCEKIVGGVVGPDEGSAEQGIAADLYPWIEGDDGSCIGTFYG